MLRIIIVAPEKAILFPRRLAILRRAGRDSERAAERTIPPRRGPCATSTNGMPNSSSFATIIFLTEPSIDAYKREIQCRAVLRRCSCVRDRPRAPRCLGACCRKCFSGISPSRASPAAVRQLTAHPERERHCAGESRPYRTEMNLLDWRLRYEVQNVGAGAARAHDR